MNPSQKPFDRLWADSSNEPFCGLDALRVVLLVATARLFFDWAVLGSPTSYPFHDWGLYACRLLFAFAMFVAVFRVSAGVDDASLTWRGAAALVALNLLPPWIDRIVVQESFAYDVFVRQAIGSSGFGWGLVGSYGHSVGEPVAGWLVVALGAAFVWFATRKPVATVVALALTYGAVVAQAAAPHFAEHLREANDWPLEHRETILALVSAFGAFALYIAVHPRLARGLAARIPHAMPFVACFFAGGAYAGEITADTFVYAAVLLMLFVVWLLQNDLVDAPDDARQGRVPYVRSTELGFVTAAFGLAWVTLFTASAWTPIPLVVLFATVTLYNLPFYRAKLYFPSNLKMEGVWGLASFVLGMTTSLERAAYGAPRWGRATSTGPHRPELLEAFDAESLLAMLLVFAGFSLVATLKDYKDWEADLAAGVQTVYTLASRRGLSLRPIHTILTVASAAALAASSLLMTAAGRLSWPYATGGIATGLLVYIFMMGPPSTRRFQCTLWIVTAYFAFLALAMRHHGVHPPTGGI